MAEYTPTGRPQSFTLPALADPADLIAILQTFADDAMNAKGDTVTGDYTITGTVNATTLRQGGASIATITGTQTLTNKTMSGASNTFSNIPQSAVTDLAATITALPTTYAPLNPSINAQTGTTYTLVAADNSRLVTCNNGSAVTVTVPPSVFSAGNVVNLAALGAGQVAVAPGVGVTLNSADGSRKLRVQYSTAVLVCLASNSFLLTGDLTA